MSLAVPNTTYVKEEYQRMPGVLAYLEVSESFMEWLIDFKPNTSNIGVTTKSISGTGKF